MPQQGQIFRILVASPSDCAKERKAIPEVIYSWNAVHSFRAAAILEPVLWETHATPELGDRPQAIINKQLLTQCDVLIGVFWTRLGTNTGSAESGTVEEIEEFRKTGKPVLLYFSSAPVVPDSINSEQYKKLIEYKKMVEGQGIIFSYDSVGQLRELLQRHLSTAMNALIAIPTQAGAAAFKKEGNEGMKALKMYKSQFESFLRRFEAEWVTERDTEPNGIDDGKVILKSASYQLLDFLQQIVNESGSNIKGILQDALKRIKELERHDLYLDGGISYREFWEKGNEVLEIIKGIPKLLDKALASA